MNMTDLIPDAKPIDFDDIRVGDLIARKHPGGILLSVAFEQRVDPHVWFSKDESTFAAIRGDVHHLIHRPKNYLPDEPGSIVRIINHGTMPGHFARTDIPQLMFKEPGTGLFIGLGSRGLVRMEPKDFDLYDAEVRRVWITDNDPTELSSDRF